MKGITILLLALCCHLSETQTQECLHVNPDNCGLVKELAIMGEKLAVMDARLQASEKEVGELKRLIGDRPQVAFSATLSAPGTSGNTGPFTANTALQYKNVFSNIGSCYNPATGIFTSMVKGMYYFRFSMMNNLDPVANSVVSLMKNEQRLVSVWDVSGSDVNDIGSNAAVIPLEVGDNVYVQLLANRVIYDDAYNYNTFSGFLLFSM